MVTFGEARRQCREKGYAYKDEDGVEVCGPRAGLCACKDGNCFSVKYWDPDTIHPHEQRERERENKERLLEQFGMKDQYAEEMGTD